MGSRFPKGNGKFLEVVRPFGKHCESLLVHWSLMDVVQRVFTAPCIFWCITHPSRANVATLCCLTRCHSTATLKGLIRKQLSTVGGMERWLQARACHLARHHLQQQQQYWKREGEGEGEVVRTRSRRRVHATVHPVAVRRSASTSLIQSCFIEAFAATASASPPFASSTETPATSPSITWSRYSPPVQTTSRYVM